jgi:hypothetical protein
LYFHFKAWACGRQSGDLDRYSRRLVRLLGDSEEFVVSRVMPAKSSLLPFAGSVVMYARIITTSQAPASSTAAK